MWITLSAGEDCFLARGYDTFLISGFSGLDPMKYTPPPPPKSAAITPEPSPPKINALMAPPKEIKEP